MEITAFKDKSRILPMLAFGHSTLNILSYISPLDANSNWLDSWLEDLSAYQISTEKDRYERDDFSKWHMNYANKQVLWRNKFKVLLKASKPTSKFLFRQFSFSKSKIKVWRFFARLFLFF
jgi:hypothetical protein